MRKKRILNTGKGRWKKGPPPSVGWWPASTKRSVEVLRWWDGEQWSWAAHRYQSAVSAAREVYSKVSPERSRA